MRLPPELLRGLLVLLDAEAGDGDDGACAAGLFVDVDAHVALHIVFGDCHGVEVGGVADVVESAAGDGGEVGGALVALFKADLEGGG